MPRARYNHAAAFMEFIKGTTLADISHALAIPLEQVHRWSWEEGWEKLRSRADAPALLPAKVDKTVQQMERLQANREKNLEIAQKLQEDLIGVIDKMREGKLKVERVFANGSRVTMEPTLRDRCDIALYAKNVADISYRALGDTESAKSSPADSGLPSAGQITIVLPPLLTAPREKQAKPAQDIDATVVYVDGLRSVGQGDGSLNHCAPPTEPA